MAETVVELDLSEVSPMQREVNKGLMVAWINADLINRAQHDVRKSIVLYDADKDFVYAVDKVPDDATFQRLHKAGVRFYSTGVV